MWRRQLIALVRNDLRVHGPGIAGMVGVILAVTTLFYFVPPPRGDHRTAVASATFNLNVMLAIMLGEFLAAREKTKGTFAWLRTLPIADATVISSKFVSAWGWCVASWVITSVPFDRGTFFPDGWATWLVLLLLCVTLASGSLWARLCFPQRRGLIFLFAGAGMVMASGFALQRASPDLTMRVVDAWAAGVGKAIAAAALVACTGGLFTASAMWMSRSETTRLLE